MNSHYSITTKMISSHKRIYSYSTTTRHLNYNSLYCSLTTTEFVITEF